MLNQAQVGRFEVRDFLGRGAIGDVFLAWDPEAEREVALKVVRAKKTDPDMLEAEKNGVALQQQLAAVAPQVAGVYGWGDEGDLFWMAMEYVDGTDLSQVVDAGPVEEARALLIVHQLCEMLEVCHQFSAELGGRKVFGIVHGDIKPENIRLQPAAEGTDGAERVRVLDFGIAKHLSQTRRFTVNLFGSLPYTPPERLDRGAVDRGSDLWAVGVILYLLVSGELPFRGDDVEDVERKIRQGTPPDPLPGGCPRPLQHIVHRALAFDPEGRYASASALRADLEAYGNGQPLPSEEEAGPVPDVSATRRTSRPVPLDATRRTGRAPLASASGETGENGETGAEPLPFAPLGATRRTGGTEASELQGLQEMPPPAPPPVPFAQSLLIDTLTERPPSSRRRTLRGFSVAAGIGFLVASQMWVRGEAREIRHDLLAQTSPDLDGLYGRYRDASRLSLQGGSLGGAREELRSALVRSADRIVDSYHGDAPSTSQSGWQTAHDRLQAAIELDLNDRPTRAKLHYSRGHLLRIAAQTQRNKGQLKEGGEKMRDAVGEFKEAAQLSPEWPDPYLGLARVYAYETFDFEELKKALDALGQRSYPVGRRETAMLADGDRMHAADLKAQADALRDQPDQTEREVEILESARTALEDSLSLYGQIPNYGSSKANRAKADAQLEAVNDRLGELGSF